MSVRIKHLNADSSFLLIFSPPYAPHNPQGTFPGSFTVLVDPWLSGPSKVISSRFALTYHVVPSCIESLAELPDPDLVLVSQDKPDHCHLETLAQLPQDTQATILGVPAAAKKIRNLKHFDPAQVHALKRYDHRKDDTVYRIPIPAISLSGEPGEVTITLMTNRFDVTGLHNAIGITYRAPSSVLSSKTGSYVSLPLTPPTTPPLTARPMTSGSMSSGKSTVTSITSSVGPLSAVQREKALSVLYSPHGLEYAQIEPYASSHLLAESALPLTAMLHCFDRTINPWYLGGTIQTGSEGGVELARNLYAKAWISAHDEDKANSGISTHSLKAVRYRMDEIREMLQQGSVKGRNTTSLHALESGEEVLVAMK